MDLDLDIRTRGRAKRHISAESVRELTEADLAVLSEERGSRAAPLKRIGERHHSLARALASGMKTGEAALLVGLTPSRVSILLDDPTFKELVEFYRENVDAAYADLHSRLVGMSIDAIEELRRRLEEDPENMSAGLLMEMVTKAADRTGYGPQTKQDVNVNVNLADRLEAARKRVSERRMIDVTPSEDGS